MPPSAASVTAQVPSSPRIRTTISLNRKRRRRPASQHHTAGSRRSSRSIAVIAAALPRARERTTIKVYGALPKLEGHYTVIRYGRADPRVEPAAPAYAVRARSAPALSRLEAWRVKCVRHKLPCKCPFMDFPMRCPRCTSFNNLVEIDRCQLRGHIP